VLFCETIMGRSQDTRHTYERQRKSEIVYDAAVDRLMRQRDTQRAQAKQAHSNKPKQKQRDTQPPRPPRMAYKDYLRCEWWKWRRLQALKKAKHRCQRCNDKAKLQVHHKTYVRLGRERDEDLEVVCRSCHEQEHECWIAANAHLDAITGR
jgi:hypothetical protein